MDHYRVVDISADGFLVALHDHRGGNHIASLSVPSLQMGDEIQGGVARLGMQLFMSSDCTRIHRLTMLHIGCAMARFTKAKAVVVNEVVGKNLSASTLKDDAYTFMADQQGLMASRSIEGTEISRIKR